MPIVRRAERPAGNNRRILQYGGIAAEYNGRLGVTLAGDAVLIAPVSGKIPCKQGILQGKWQIWALDDAAFN
jgi:hypothetical protein